MSYKVGLLLSMIFLVSIFVFAGELISVQIIYTNIDAVSVTAGSIIARNGEITQDVVDLVSDEASARIYSVNDAPPMFGEVFEYCIVREYDSKFLSREPLEISIVRSVIIGYFN